MGNKPRFIYLVLLIVMAGHFYSCVPIRKQLVARDKNKRHLKQMQSVDTTLRLTPYKYKIRKGDIISVEISSITKSEYSLEPIAKKGGDAGSAGVSGYLVNDTGYVDVPVLGMVKVEGMEVDKAGQKIRTLASQYLNNVLVTVKLLNFEVKIVGELKGIVRSEDGNINVYEALSQTGWSAEYANMQRVKIIRTEIGGEKIRVFYVDISDVGIIATPDFFLRPNDILVLEPRRVKNLNSTRTLIAFGLSVVSAVFIVYNAINLFTNNK
jgi:polysaccharide biosynthesis/export protein